MREATVLTLIVQVLLSAAFGAWLGWMLVQAWDREMTLWEKQVRAWRQEFPAHPQPLPALKPNATKGAKHE